MFYYLYEIRNKLNDKIYVGVHKTRNMNDGYMGSGVEIRNAIEKYGIENFEKVILETFENAEAMYAREKEIVNEEFLSKEDTYNLRRGGNGGFDHINRIGKNLYGKNGQLGYGLENLYKGWSRIKTEEENRKISNTLKEGYSSGRIINKFKGKKHTEETKRVIGEKNAINQAGEKNSQFGTCWVTHIEHGNKKIKLKNLNTFLSLGYSKGRRLKK